MHRLSLLTAVFALLMAAVSANLHNPLAASAQDASPAAESGSPPGLRYEILVAGLAELLPEAPAIVLMERVTIAPETDIPTA